MAVTDVWCEDDVFKKCEFFLHLACCREEIDVSNSDQFFIAWVAISLIWLWFTLLVSNFYPLIDGGAKQIWTVIRGRKGMKGTTEFQTDSGVSTPPTERIRATPKES